MALELKRNVINMKSLDQDIKDPVLVGGGDADGRTLAIVFTQEAAARLTPATKVYLKWRHQQTDTIGYNVFDKVADKPPTWEIKYPKSLLYEGDVTATVELVDDISISASTTFIIRVLSDPYPSSRVEASDDLTVFQKAVVDLASIDSQSKRLDELLEQAEELLDRLRSE